MVGVEEVVISNRIIRKGFTVRFHLDKALRIPGSKGSSWRAQQMQKLKEEGRKSWRGQRVKWSECCTSQPCIGKRWNRDSKVTLKTLASNLTAMQDLGGF